MSALKNEVDEDVVLLQYQEPPTQYAVLRTRRMIDVGFRVE